MDELFVSRLYRRYLSELGIGFSEMRIISLLADGAPRPISQLSSELEFGEHAMTTHLGALKDAGLIFVPNTLDLSVQLTAAALQLGDALLVVQANVDLDFGVASESITRIRNALVALVRRTRLDGHG